ncbi:MAG: hypothetical protein A2170_10050 [Deltaproteobacteria bacterium RBG_13_53_10]|nr:MAG: hypothetical protein A2170_10050 [Deltaproteobacteria bacterium RBG_13_53_10]
MTNKNCAVPFLILSLSISCVGQNPQKRTQALFDAVQNGNLQGVLALLDKGVDVNCRGAYNYTPLITAARYTQMEIARALCDRGADVNVATDIAEPHEWGSTPLLWAAENCHVEMAEYLISKGAEVGWPGGEGDTPLMVAARKGCQPIVDILIAKGAAVEAVREFDSATALIEAVSRGNLNVAIDLIAYGANIGRKDRNGNSLLLLSAAGGHYDQVRYFFEKGLPVDDKDGDGNTAIYHAIGNSVERRYILEFLIEHGVDPTIKGNVGISPLLAASVEAVESEVRLLIDHGADVNESDSWKSTPLHHACRVLSAKHGLKDSVATIRLLLDKGAQVNAIDSDGKTPLIVASGGEEPLQPQVQVIEILLEHGAQVNIQDNRGWTALMHAASWNQTAVIKVLTRWGADLNIRTSAGNTALAITKKEKRLLQAYKLLKNLGAKD